MSTTARATDWAQDRLVAAEDAYRRRNPRSHAAMRELSRWLPGGDTRSTTWFEPFPLVIDRAAGVELHDLDGHLLLDFIGNYTALVHGHVPTPVTAATAATLEQGTVFAAPIREQGELAARLVSRIPSIELVRFTSSGTEANLLAARIARAVTGRRRLAVARHYYHGSWEELDWRRAPDTGAAVFEANDLDATARLLGDGRDLAAIFVEPVLGSGGVIPLTTEYLRFLRDYADDCGALLVFDEVMTLRLGHGGRQEVVGVRPDLTTLGKLIGGGLPIGAVGGAAAIMESTDPRRADALAHSGTFNGNRLAMVAGAAALDALDRAAIDRINLLGDRLADGIAGAVQARDLPLSITACGSLMNLHSLPEVLTADDAQAAAEQPLKRLLHLTLLEHGIFIAPRGELCTNTAMDETTIDTALAAIGRAFDALR